MPAAIGVVNVLTRLDDPRCSLVVVVAAAAALKRDVYGTVIAGENPEARTVVSASGGASSMWVKGLSAAYHRLGLCGVLYPVIGFWTSHGQKRLTSNPTSLIAGTAWLGRAVTQRGTQARKLRGHVIVVEGHLDLRTLYVCARPSPSRPFMIRKLSHRHLRIPGWDDDVPSPES